MQHPAVAPVLFVGLLYFWLIPAIHTRVMLDANLYALMNWTMAINGIFFWWLVLDPRPKPPARLSSLMRGLMILLIELPQMVLGAILSLSMTDYYPVYTICGRIFDMTALNDQHYGGLIIWLPGTLTSFAAMIAVLMIMRINGGNWAELARQTVLRPSSAAALLFATPRVRPRSQCRSAMPGFARCRRRRHPAAISRSRTRGTSDVALVERVEFCSRCGMLMMHKSEEHRRHEQHGGYCAASRCRPWRRRSSSRPAVIT